MCVASLSCRLDQFALPGTECSTLSPPGFIVYIILSSLFMPATFHSDPCAQIVKHCLQLILKGLSVF